MAPTTKKGAVTLTSAAGNAYYPLNLQGLITSVPRHFYARSSAYRINHLQKCLKEGLGWKGFAFIDVISFCIENNGRRLGYKNGFEMLDKLKADFKINTDPSGPLAANELGIIQNENQKS
ncbi:MAG: hypothetical protein L6425_02945, partial [Candidatus Aminicenantes bacterium]|nr:hypothetical protein [Candidatus Aminicenantes bacterium]